MGAIQDIIGGIGNMFGGTPKKPKDFWDRMQGHPLEREETYNRIANADVQRAISERGGIEAALTPQLRTRGRDQVDANVNQAERITDADIARIQKRVEEQERGRRKVVEMAADADLQHSQDPNTFLSRPTQAKSQSQLAELLNQDNSVAQSTRDPRTGTPTGREALAADTGAIANRAVAKRNTAEADKLITLNNTLIPEFNTEQDLRNAQIKAILASGKQTELMGPAAVKESESRAELNRSNAQYQQDRRDVIPIGGGAYMERNPVTGEYTYHSALEMMRRGMGGSGLPGSGPGAAVDDAGDAPTALPSEKFREILENYKNRGVVR